MRYYGIMARRSGASDLGAAEDWVKRDGIPEVFTSRADALARLDRYNRRISSPNVHYTVQEMPAEFAQAVHRRQGMEVAQAIDQAVRESHYDTFHYNLKGAAEKVIGAYGTERVNAVLANILLTHDSDGRYSGQNKRWAREFDIVPDRGLYSNTHPHVLDGFIDRAREITAKIEAERPAEMVGSYTVTRSIRFDNDRGFAYGENPGAVQPFATWQFTSENGVRDHYWGHYHSGQDDALKDYENRVNEYMAEHPFLKVVVDNPLATAEKSAEQNYNQIDGVLNNMAAPKADLTDGATYEEIKELAPEMLPVEVEPEPLPTPPPKGRRFENVDVLAALGAVVAKNTVGFQTDFEHDKALLVKAAESPAPEDKHLLWLSRKNGTECFTERDVYFTGTWEHNAWTYFDAGKESIVAFAIKITGMEDGKVMGALYELDHARHVREVKRHAAEPESVLLAFEGGAQHSFPYREWKENFAGIRQEHGVVTAQRFEAADESALQAVLTRQRETRARFPARSFDAFLKRLPRQERPSVKEKLNAAMQAVKPPAPGKKPPAKSGPEL